MPDLTIAVLTGRRPDLLDRTLTSFANMMPDLWANARRVVVHNGGDPETRRVLARHRWDALQETPWLLRIAEASQVLADLAGHHTPFVLRLEDDWQCVNGGWWEDAARALERADFAQVRLRLATEKVMVNHRATGNRIRWQPWNGHRIASAHYTHQPSVMRTADWKGLFPYDDEVDAARKMEATGKLTVQLVPGAFRHLGVDGRSLKWNGGAP